MNKVKGGRRLCKQVVRTKSARRDRHREQKRTERERDRRFPCFGPLVNSSRHASKHVCTRTVAICYILQLSLSLSEEAYRKKEMAFSYGRQIHLYLLYLSLSFSVSSSVVHRNLTFNLFLVFNFLLSFFFRFFSHIQFQI